MKPAWDDLGTEFAESSTVVIGDADCTVEKDLCSEHGVRGYPTIKYWEDGEVKDYKGGRDLDTLRKFVQETLDKAGCSIEDESNCGAKEITYLGKMKEKSKEDQQKELDRLEKIKGNKMMPEQKKYLAQRINILKQLVA